jgi:integrase
VPTVADYSRRWLDGLDLEAATIAGYRRIFTLHVDPAIGGGRVDKVSPTRLAKLYTDLQRPDPACKRAPDGLSKNSTHKVHVALSARPWPRLPTCRPPLVRQAQSIRGHRPGQPG